MKGSDDVSTLIAESDTGGRVPRGFFSRRVLWLTPLVWSLFQLWIASPFPFILGVGVWNDTRTRAIHLSFAVFLAFIAFPTWKRSPRDRIPLQDWILACVAAGVSGYIWIFYNEISSRTGAPSTEDVVIGVIGCGLLLESARRSLGFPLMAVAAFFLGYVFFGSWEIFPDIVRWKGASLEKAMSHMWLTTEGVFGVALGVSSSFVFLFVLFGALLNQAGAGNYFVQLSFSLLGHLRGGPAKAAVLSSAMTGLVSGSSIANVVTTGTFTIPLMKRVGFSSQKAGAIEVSSSVNGVLTPPVMGTVAFLMTEYVGVSYVEVVKAAIVPALISYIALIYIVHLEAMKNDMKGLERLDPPKPWKVRLIRMGLSVSSLCIVLYGLYWFVKGLQIFLGSFSLWPILFFLVMTYGLLVYFSAKSDDLEVDDLKERVVKLHRFGDIVGSGLYYVIPLVVLVWLLVVEWKSPGFSAYWATLVMVIILLTQKPLKSFFRKEEFSVGVWREGVKDLGEGLVVGARNMIGLATAMGVAGIIVGTVTLTGIGQVMAEFVEFLSGGHLLAMLFFVALISIVLGMGLPTTANYIVVSSLMAGVVVELGAEQGLIVPLIAVHMFVFYYGIMADVTPPVGLASFAAAAISGADPLKTGVTAFFYSLRTALLPFIFIFNTDLLLIDVEPLQAIFVFVVALIAMLVFAAGTMGYFLVRSRLWESVVLVLVALMLFRPGFLLDRFEEPFLDEVSEKVYEVAENTADDGFIRLHFEGVNVDGEDVSSEFLLPLGKRGGAGAERLEQYAGLELVEREGGVWVESVVFGGKAERSGVDFDWELVSVKVENERVPKELFYIPTFLLLGLVAGVQWRRRREKEG